MKAKNLIRLIVVILGVLSLGWFVNISDLNPLLFNETYRNFLNQFADAHPLLVYRVSTFAFLTVICIGCYGNCVHNRRVI